VKNKRLGKWAAGLLAASLVATEASAQQQGGQTGSTGATGGTTGTNNALSGISGNSGQQGGTNANFSGINLDNSMIGGRQTGSGAAQGTRSSNRAGRSTRGRTQSAVRTGAITGGRGGVGQNSLNTQRRDSRQRAQYSMAIEPIAMSIEPRPTLELRDTVQESITASLPGGVKVAVEGTEVVLIGAVPSDADRRLAELLASLEPGVRSVRNELVVEKPAK